MQDQPPNIVETALPGIGTKFRMDTERRERLVAVAHNDGLFELYWSRRAGEDPSAVIALSEDEARCLGLVLTGAYGGVRHAPEDLGLNLPDLGIDWTPIPTDSPLAGTTIGSCEFRQRTGAYIVAILREGTSIPVPEPDEPLQAGDTLVTVGRPGSRDQVIALLQGRGDPVAPGPA
jgi:TrkA domain protein